MTNKYMENRKNISIVNDVYDELVNIRKEMELKSLTDVIDVLLQVKKQVIVKHGFKCDKCEQHVKLSQNTKPNKLGLIHSHLEDTNCNGCIKKTYIINGTNDKKDERSGTNESNDETSDATDTTEEKKKVLDGVNSWDDNSKDILEWSPQKRSLWADGNI